MLVTKALPQDVAYLAFVPLFPRSGSRLAPRKAFAATEINDIEEKKPVLERFIVQELAKLLYRLFQCPPKGNLSLLSL
ncbi:hypothetical protein [Solibacillus sp. FSL H8-0538]|uniref:hypothetical protein n=1 Tax=Solibacillus sp. FSL H8-0538 TaxID=2921400 RepID=UPI0030F7B0A1